MAASSN